jgi:hypothetical protein
MNTTHAFQLTLHYARYISKKTVHDQGLLTTIEVIRFMMYKNCHIEVYHRPVICCYNISGVSMIMLYLMACSG